MKKINVMRLIMAVMALSLFFACSTESVEEIEQQQQQQEVEFLLRDGSGGAPPSNPVSGTCTIVVEYNFPSFTLPNGQVLELDEAGKEAFKQNYRDEMAQHFTIHSVIESNCIDVEKWIVDCDEYEDYISANYATDGTGGDTNSQNDAVLKEPIDYVGSCFNDR